MSKNLQLVAHEPLDVVRSLAIRQQVDALSPEKHEIITMLYGIGRGRLDLPEVAWRLGRTMDEVRRLRDAALRDLGMGVALEAAA